MSCSFEDNSTNEEYRRRLISLYQRIIVPRSKLVHNFRSYIVSGKEFVAGIFLLRATNYTFLQYFRSVYCSAINAIERIRLDEKESARTRVGDSELTFKLQDV